MIFNGLEGEAQKIFGKRNFTKIVKNFPVFAYFWDLGFDGSIQKIWKIFLECGFVGEGAPTSMLVAILNQNSVEIWAEIGQKSSPKRCRKGYEKGWRVLTS